MKDEIVLLKRQLQKSEDLYNSTIAELIETKEKNSFLNSELEKEKAKSSISDFIKNKEKGNLGIEKESESLKEMLLSSNAENKRLSDENIALKFELDESKKVAKIENEVVEELEKANDYLRSVKIEVTSFIEVKSNLKNLTLKFDDFREVWRKEFELIKKFLEELKLDSNVNDSLVAEKTLRFISLLRKLKRLADLEIILKERYDELTLKINEFKKLLDM